ncbi:MAG: hypothetical protein R3D44_11495 [Hyphomicrobiaceae bacterium]
MRLQRETVTPENAFRLMNTFAEIDVRDLLPSIRAPTLVMHVKDDAVVPLHAGKEIASGIKGARFIVLEEPQPLSSLRSGLDALHQRD